MIGAHLFSRLPVKTLSFTFAHSHQAKNSTDTSKFSYLKRIFINPSKLRIENIVNDAFLNACNSDSESIYLRDIRNPKEGSQKLNKFALLQTIKQSHPELAGRKNLKNIETQINKLSKSQESWSKEFPIVYMPYLSGKNSYLSKIKLEDQEKWCIIEKYNPANAQKFFKQSGLEKSELNTNSLEENQEIHLAAIQGITQEQLDALHITPLYTKTNKLGVAFIKSDNRDVKNNSLGSHQDSALLTYPESLPMNISYSIRSIIPETFTSESTRSPSASSRSIDDSNNMSSEIDKDSHFSYSTSSSVASSPRGLMYATETAPALTVNSVEPEQPYEPDQPPTEFARLIQSEKLGEIVDDGIPVQLEKLIPIHQSSNPRQVETTQHWFTDLRARLVEGFLMCITDCAKDTQHLI